jgi:thiol-disulfide isomerase/thioredoxin
MNISRLGLERRGTLFALSLLLFLALGWYAAHRQFNHWLGVRLLLHSENPRDEWFQTLAEECQDPNDFLRETWSTGKVPHRLLVAGFLKDKAVQKKLWFKKVEDLLEAGTADGDMSVRELALASMESRNDPHLLDCAQAQLVDPDPLVRQLGLEYLRKTPPQQGVPVVIKLLDDPDLRVIARAELALSRWTGQDFGARVRLAIASPGASPGEGITPENLEKLHHAIEQRKLWWQQHAHEFETNYPPAEIVRASPRPPLADFSLKDLNGRVVSLADFKGRPVLLNFWATWCPACLAEIPDLVALQKKAGDRVAIVGIALDGLTDEHGHVPGEEEKGNSHHEKQSVAEIARKVSRAVKTRGINYTVLLDPRGTVGGRFNGGELPTTVIIDATGCVRRRFIGERSLTVFEAMLAEASKPAP